MNDWLKVIHSRNIDIWRKSICYIITLADFTIIPNDKMLLMQIILTGYNFRMDINSHYEAQGLSAFKTLYDNEGWCDNLGLTG